MIKINEVAFIAYPSTDIARSKAFYEGILGLNPSQEAGGEGWGWIEYDLGATTLGVGQSSQWKPSQDGPTLALEVDNFLQTIDHLRQHGLTFAMEPFETPVCHMALIRDPDGNKLMIHKRKSDK